MRLTCLLFCCCLTASAAAQNSIGWTLAWSDEFAQADGSSPDPAKWAYDIGAGGWGNNELQYYTSRTNNVRIEGGVLVIEARKENYNGSNYTSARLKTKGKAWWTYGRLEARIQIPRGQGIWPAFWTLGTNINSIPWPGCGEIDVMENIGREPGLVHGTVHGPGYSGGENIGAPYALPDGGAFADDFHVYAVEWTTNQLKWFVDGRQYFSAAPASLPAGGTWVFALPQFLLLNVAVGGNWPGYPDGTTIFPQRMRVDYVRVYAPAPLPVSRVNALTNAGFESAGLADWSAYGAGFNTLLAGIGSLPVHDGSNAFKVFGQFNGAENYSGILQDRIAPAGQSYMADGWALTPGNDAVAGANTAWMEVTFRDSATNTLTAYRTALISTNTVPGVWLFLAATNQIDPSTGSVIGSVSTLVAPANTAFVRCQVVFRQPAMAAGAVLFDDLRLAEGGPAEFPVPATVGCAGGGLDLGFATYLDVPYEVRWKTNLLDPDWLVLTNVSGDGAVRSVGVDLQAASGFYRVAGWCN